MKLKTASGFTLIEVMTVVVILALLAVIAFPSYQEQVRKGKRAEGKAALLRAAQLQERSFTDNNRYADSASNPSFQSLMGQACPYPVFSAENCADASGAYRITVALGAGNTSFTLTATPNGGHTDASCGNLTLDSSGVRGRSGAAPMNTCW
jgi:type IV pilus assembly protein PilE